MAVRKRRGSTPSGFALERVIFIGQDRAETMRPPKSCALVSITDPAKAPADLLDGWTAVLRVQFHDIDPVSYPADSDDLHPISAAQAAEIADFCWESALRCRRLVVHCRYGVSRSAAIAKAVCDVLGLAFPADYDDHNDYVCRVVLSAMRSRERLSHPQR
jgi:predicted protein tyrosine phosphatase